MTEFADLIIDREVVIEAPADVVRRPITEPAGSSGGSGTVAWPASNSWPKPPTGPPGSVPATWKWTCGTDWYAGTPLFCQTATPRGRRRRGQHQCHGAVPASGGTWPGRRLQPA